MQLLGVSKESKTRDIMRRYSKWRNLLGQPRWLLLDAWLWLSCTCWSRMATWMVCPSSSGSSARKCAWWNGWSACSRALLTSLSMTCRIRWTCSLGFRIGWNTSSVYDSNSTNRTVTNPLLSMPCLILIVSGRDIFYLKIILEYWQV